MAVPEPPGEKPAADDAAMLIAALNHITGWHEARIDRGLQVINYYVVAAAVLATAYVSAVGGKHYAIAFMIALSGTGLTVLTFIVGRRQRRSAAKAAPALDALQERLARRLQVDSLHLYTPEGRAERDHTVGIAFALAAPLGAGSAIYALIH